MTWIRDLPQRSRTLTQNRQHWENLVVFPNTFKVVFINFRPDISVLTVHFYLSLLFNGLRPVSSVNERAHAIKQTFSRFILLINMRKLQVSQNNADTKVFAPNTYIRSGYWRELQTRRVVRKCFKLWRFAFFFYEHV